MGAILSPVLRRMSSDISVTASITRLWYVESNALLAIVAEAHGGADVPAAAVGGV